MTKPNEILIKQENGEYSVWLGFPETIPQRTQRALIDFVETGRLAYYRDDDFDKSENLADVKKFLIEKNFADLPTLLQIIKISKYNNFYQLLGA